MIPCITKKHKKMTRDFEISDQSVLDHFDYFTGGTNGSILRDLQGHGTNKLLVA